MGRRHKKKAVRPEWLPLELRVGGAKYDVRFERTESDNALGECSTAETFIRVSPYTPVGRKVSEESMKSTFWHELVHVILDTMDEYELSSNEKFVSVFSSMLNEAICTSKWKDDLEAAVDDEPDVAPETEENFKTPAGPATEVSMSDIDVAGKWAVTTAAPVREEFTV